MEDTAQFYMIRKPPPANQQLHPFNGSHSRKLQIAREARVKTATKSNSTLHLGHMYLITSETRSIAEFRDASSSGVGERKSQKSRISVKPDQSLWVS